MMLRPGCRVLIEHSTPLVAQDLREIFLSAGASDVVLLRADDAPVTEMFDLYVTDAKGTGDGIPEVLARADEMARSIILVVSALNSLTDLPSNMRILAEPFRTEDVMQALVDAGLAEPDPD